MKTRILGFGIAMLVLALLSTGCYYDNEETLYPPGVCDTAEVKYSQQITYIISNKCYDCHSNATAAISGSNESWEGYANLSGYLAAGTGAATFINSINHEVGYTPMPKDRPKLSPCDIRTIEIWIENGYPNN
jgi:hypothetical protein